MIINIRGTGGSGKSWVVRQLMERYGAGPITVDGKILGYEFNIIPTRDAGRYDVESGGCDRINTQDEVAERLKGFVLGPYKPDSGGVDNLHKAVRAQESIEEEEVRNREPEYHVIFEGLLVSGIYGRWRDFAKSVPDFRWVFLNTSLEQCLENTRARRVKAGKPPEFNPEATVNKYKSVRSIYHKTRYDRLNSYDVSSNEAIELISGWISS